ncbi:MAG: hypothetical protein ABIT96_06810 [Ferruginibacter sp.]
MRKIYSLTLLFSIFSLFSFAQTNPDIKITSAFFTVSSPGAQMVKQDGQAVDKSIIKRYMIMEAAKGKPIIVKEIKIDGQEYKVNAVEMLPPVFEVGKTYADNKSVKVSASNAGVQQWKVSFMLKGGSESTAPLKEFKVKGTVGGSSFKLEFPEDLQLNGEVYN